MQRTAWCRLASVCRRASSQPCSTPGCDLPMIGLFPPLSHFCKARTWSSPIFRREHSQSILQHTSIRASGVHHLVILPCQLHGRAPAADCGAPRNEQVRHAQGVAAQQYDAWDIGVTTNDCFGNADVVYPVTLPAVRTAVTRLRAERAHVPVVTGFLGRGQQTGGLWTWQHPG